MHLTDEQLIALIYDEGVANDQQPFDSGAAREHLERCPACHEQMNHLLAVGRSLDQWAIEPPAELNTLPTVNASPNIAETRSWISRIALAASVLLMLGIAFLAGSHFQARQISDRIQRGIAAELADRTPPQEPPSNTEEWNQVARNLKDSIEDLGRRLETANSEKVNAFQDAVERLILEQIALRQDLETLAVNAESEIQLTNDEIRKINELVSSFFIATE